MSHGIVARAADGLLALHSDYSSLGYLGEMGLDMPPARLVYDGEDASAISDAAAWSNYRLGRNARFSIAARVSRFLPFYLPRTPDQEICVMDAAREGGRWICNVVFGGDSADARGLAPRLFAFGPLAEAGLPAPEGHGLAAWDAGGRLVFSDSAPVLRAKEAAELDWPAAIRVAPKGSVAPQDPGSAAAADAGMTPDQSRVFASASSGPSRIFHVVPAAYGGLSFRNEGTYRRTCGFLGLSRRQYAWGYFAWAQFRAACRHDATGHVATWLADSAGKKYRLVSGDCGLSIVTAILGLLLAPFTLGASLGLLAVGALGGYVVGGALSRSAPSLRAWEADEVVDPAHASLVVADAEDLGIDWRAGHPGEEERFRDDRTGGGGSVTAGDFFWQVADIGNPGSVSIHVVWDGEDVFLADAPASAAESTSLSGSDGWTYLRGSHRLDRVVTFRGRPVTLRLHAVRRA